MTEKTQAKLVEGPIAKTLARLTVPMIGGILSVMIFNLADAFFVGQLGSGPLAAIGFTFPVVFLLGSVAIGLGTGTASVVSRAIGEGDQSEVRRLTTDSLLLSLIIVFALAMIGFLTIDPLFRLLGANEKILPLIHDYMSIWYAGMVFLVVPMVGNSAIRATGDTKIPGLIMVFAGIINIILDPMFIFGFGFIPRLEVQGAALATLLSRSLTLFASLWILSHREKLIIWKIIAVRRILVSWKKILYVGLPAAATNVMNPVLMGIITAMVAGYGTQAVAAFAVGGRIDAFAIIVIIALSSSLAPFIGQNWGAESFARVRAGIRYSILFTLAWELFLGLITVFSSGVIARAFNDDPLVVSTLTDYLWILPFTYGLQGTIIIVGSTFNSINMPLKSTVLTVLRLFILYLPLAFLGEYIMGLNGIFIGAAIANVISGVVAILWIRKVIFVDYIR